jgi:hypothetical protein
VADARAKVEAARKVQASADTQFRDERIRKVLLRIAMDVADPEDRKLLVQEFEPLRPQIKEEFERMKRALDGRVPKIVDPKDPEKKEKSAFYWPIITMSATDIRNLTDETGALREGVDAVPATGPWYNMPAIMKYLTDQREAADKKLRDTEERMAAAEKKAAEVVKDTGKIDTLFKDKIAENTAEIKKDFAKRDVDFKAFVAKHALDAENFRKQLAVKGVEVKEKDAELAIKDDKIKSLSLLLEKLQNQNSRLGTSGAIAVDSLNLEEKKGEITRKDGNGFVTINIGSSKKLRTQVTFLVVSADVSWLALQDKEKALERASSRIDRQPYEDNPYVKAGIEVVEILGPESSRAKIIFENERSATRSRSATRFSTWPGSRPRKSASPSPASSTWTATALTTTTSSSACSSGKES